MLQYLLEHGSEEFKNQYQSMIALPLDFIFEHYQKFGKTFDLFMDSYYVTIGEVKEQIYSSQRVRYTIIYNDTHKDIRIIHYYIGSLSGYMEYLSLEQLEKKISHCENSYLDQYMTQKEKEIKIKALHEVLAICQKINY